MNDKLYQALSGLCSDNSIHTFTYEAKHFASLAYEIADATLDAREACLK